ncbi:MAG: aminopeptidase P family protein [Burkholderiaceae bacterium]|nr:aminopeptidase P family protein [Burkholderiaceae bacterium]
MTQTPPILVNTARMHERMQRDGLDALVATSSENVTYSSGYWALSQWIRRGPQVYVLLPAPGRGDDCIVTSTGLADLVADGEVWVDEVRRYGFFATDHEAGVPLDAASQRFKDILDGTDWKDPVAALVAAIRERGLERGRIGIDEMGTTPVYWDRIREALPDATIVPAAETFRWIRAIKTPEEVRRLREAAQITERSIAAALAIARPGVTELDMAREFHHRTITDGALPVLGVMGFGERSAMSNVMPTTRELKMGDVIRFDAGGRYQHYRADIARNAVMGEPTAKMKTYHEAIRRGLFRAQELIKPGVNTSYVFEQVMETVRREGIAHYRRNHVGHGIGMDGYDIPGITPGSQEVFEAGMVICIETPYYELGFAGLQVEDTLHITADGVESLMSTGTELVLL